MTTAANGLTPAFTGFPADAVGFFAGLEADNSKAYWTANRQRFEDAVRAPMRALLESLPDRYHPFTTFRMHRDLRFTPDRAPYKTMYGAAHDIGGAVHYLHIDARGLTAVTGAYVLAGDQLDRYRRAVADDVAGPELVALLDRIAVAGLAVGPGGPAPLRGTPRGYPRDHPRIALLRQKGVIAVRTLAPDHLHDAATVHAAVLDAFTAGEPLNDWLATHTR